METASQDGKVGGPIQMMVVTPKGVQQISEHDIEKLTQEAAKYNDMLRKAFYGEGR